LRDDVRVAAVYGERFPDEFGGLYLEGESLVVLFTRHVELHERALRNEVGHPDSLRVHQASRTWEEVVTSNRDVGLVLLGDGPISGVTNVGIVVLDGQFVVMVGVTMDDPAVADQVRAAVSPNPVVVEPRGRPRLAFLPELNGD
jgi:hypothetical protein